MYFQRMARDSLTGKVLNEQRREECKVVQETLDSNSNKYKGPRQDHTSTASARGREKALFPLFTLAKTSLQDILSNNYPVFYLLEPETNLFIQTYIDR